jgi:hypothetical protein
MYFHWFWVMTNYSTSRCAVTPQIVLGGDRFKFRLCWQRLSVLTTGLWQYLNRGQAWPPPHPWILITYDTIPAKSGAGIAQSVQRLATRWTEGSDFESLQCQELYLLHSVQTGSGAHTASYSMRNGGSFPKVKRPGSESHHSPPTSAEVKKTCIYTLTSHTSSWRSAWLR